MALMDVRRLKCDVETRDDGVHVALVDTEPRTLEFFAAHDTGDHPALAQEAWRIGVRALASAFAQAEEARLKDVGRSLVQDVQGELKAHLEQQEKTVSAVLRQYFNPDDGQLHQRLRAFVEDEGELARTLKQYVSGDKSELAQTLANRIGETSPIFRMLSPTQSEGVVKQMEKRFQEALEQHAKAVRDALDPAAEGTPVARFLSRLKEELKEAGDDQEKMLKALTKAIDPENEESLINRLQRDVNKANATLLGAINPDREGSPMATMKATLTNLMEKHMKQNQELLEGAEERQKRFEVEVKEALARIEQRKRDAERTTHGGLDFEDAVVTFIETIVPPGPYLAEPTGNTVGNVPGSKVGDQVVRFTDESAFKGSGLVVEAKRAGNYTVAKALDELEVAKKNRGCDVGLFVMAARHRPKGFPTFARYGSSLLVVWDDEDPATNPYLHAALAAGLALATRRRVTDEGDIDALGDVEARVRKEIERLETMSRLVENIQSNATKMEDEIRKGRKKLDVLVRKANDVLAALQVPVHEEEAERRSPVRFDALASDGAAGADGPQDAPPEGLRRRASTEAAAIAARRVRPEDATLDLGEVDEGDDGDERDDGDDEAADVSR